MGESEKEFLRLNRPQVQHDIAEGRTDQDSNFCPTCFNLSSDFLQRVSFGSGVIMGVNGPNTAKRMAIRRNIAISNTAEYHAYYFELKIIDVLDSAASGCDSCLLLRIATTRLSPLGINLNDPLLRLHITLCKGNALRLSLSQCKLPPDSEPNDSLIDDPTDGASWLFPESQYAYYEQETLGNWELYTLTGILILPVQARPQRLTSSSGTEKFCPWPTIGTCMDMEYPDSDARTALGGTARHVMGNGTSDSAFKSISDWLIDCKTNHPVCAQIDGLSSMSRPRRVIDIGDGSNLDIRLKEYDESKLHLDQPYIALSHCWGNGKHLTTTTSTVEQRKTNIPLENLSQSFQDAITIARKLQISRVWIDSLCIIQNDPEDLKTEISKMASIYSGATLVIAATSAKDGSGGCLFPREGFVTIRGAYATGDQFEIYGRQVIDHEVWDWGTGVSLKGSPWLSKSYSSVPLMSRAWCLQERALATRVIHFTKEEVVFECMRGLSCECGALETYSDYGLYNARQFVQQGRAWMHELAIKNLTSEPTVSSSVNSAKWMTSYRPVAHAYKGRRPINYHRFWRNLVEEFSSKSITKRTDCLPALSGLATIWSAQSLGRYLAGLWEGDVLRSLTWVPIEPCATDKEEMECMAPSWSWLGAQRAVQWNARFEDDIKFFVNFVAADTACHTSKLNPFGEVEYGYMMLIGDIVRKKLEISTDGLPAIAREIWWDEQRIFEPNSKYQLLKAQVKDVYLLRFCSMGDAWTKSTGHCSAMILVPATQEQLKRQPSQVQQFPSVYQRIGFLPVFPEDAWEAEDRHMQKEFYLI
ncbi:hypothetical protein HJFPF1_02304 [Paramyrothecium foliicola]|nr:hypothetical protein HJFPF1_02304 [Paramyrothecium foliicola]